jgi:WD40 repeat protein
MLLTLSLKGYGVSQMTGGHSRLLPVGIGAGKDSDAEELEMLAVRLRAELLELDVDSVQQAPAEPAPPGTKGPAGDSVSTLLITFSNSATAVALIGLFRSWIKRNSGRNPERTSPAPIPLVRPITPRRFVATPPVSPSAPAWRKRRRTAITSAAIAVFLVGAGVGIWLSQDHSTPRDHSLPLTVNTCARTSSAPSVPVELGIMSVGRPGLNKDFIGATFGPDCQVLATGGNGTVHVWNMVTGHRIAALPVFPGGWAFGAAFSPDSKTIAVPASDGTETLWDVTTGRLKGTLNSDPNGNTFCARLSTDGATLFTGGTTGIVDEWDVAAQKLMRTIPTPGIGSLALGPGGKVLAVGGADGTQRLFDVASGRKVATLAGHQGNSFALAFSPDGRTLAVGTMSGGVQWWDVVSGKLIAQSTGSVTDVAFSPDGKILAAGGYDAITLWDASTHQPITTLSLGSVGVWVSGLAFSRYGGVLAVGYDGALQLWNVAGVSRISQVSVHGPRTTVRSA